MCKPFIKNLTASFILLTSSLLVCTSSSAEKMADNDQQIIIKSQRQAGDLKNKIASYLDNVTITQCTLKITADLVQVYQAENKAETYIAKGKPAIFEQLLADGNKITLQANEIIYEPKLHSIIISGNALLRQAGSEVRGSKITYNTQTEQLEAESNTDDTVTTILKPKQEAIQ